MPRHPPAMPAAAATRHPPLQRRQRQPPLPQLPPPRVSPRTPGALSAGGAPHRLPRGARNESPIAAPAVCAYLNPHRPAIFQRAHPGPRRPAAPRASRSAHVRGCRQVSERAHSSLAGRSMGGRRRAAGCRLLRGRSGRRGAQIPARPPRAAAHAAGRAARRRFQESPQGPPAQKAALVARAAHAARGSDPPWAAARAAAPGARPCPARSPGASAGRGPGRPGATRGRARSRGPRPARFLSGAVDGGGSGLCRSVGVVREDGGDGQEAGGLPRSSSTSSRRRRRTLSPASCT